ncbi:MAG: hypothetical protein KatS3mg055_2267 [Chloroflexus sp.]|nr:MAG: hypothetical protein KatS3mg055_2267 [Chloroflexus sp.]
MPPNLIQVTGLFPDAQQQVVEQLPLVLRKVA